MANGDGQNPDLIVKEYSCPKCGEKDRFMERVVAKEREKGMIPEGLFGALEFKTQAVANPRPAIPYIPGTVKPCGTAYFDICFDCGTYYCFRVEESVAVLGQQPVQQFGKSTRHP